MIRCFASLLFILALLGSGSFSSAAILVMSPDGTYTTKISLDAARTALDTAGKTVVVTSAYTIPTDMTWPPDRTLKIEKGGLLTIAGGKTLTISGPFSAGLYQTFAGNGTVVGLKEPCIEWWGAKGDGTKDCGPAFRAMSTSAAASGGFNCKLSAGGLYRLASCDMSYEITKDEFSVFNLPANTGLVGESGARLWLDGATLVRAFPPSPPAPNIRFSCVGIRRGADSSRIINVGFTTNGWVADTGFRPCYAIAVMGDNFLIENCAFRNWPGMNPVIIGATNYHHPAHVSRPSGGVIKGCVFRNGSKNVPGNTLAIDASFIYDNGTGTNISDCTFLNDVAYIANCGGVELHGDNSIVRGSTFKNVFPGIYIGKQYIGKPGQVARGLSISNNTFTGCNGGIFFVDSADDVTIKENTFIDCSPEWWAISCTRLDGDGSGPGLLKGLTIAANSFVSTIPTDRPAIRLTGLQSSVITNNMFSGFASPIALVDSVPVQTDTVLIEGNTASHMKTDTVFTNGLVVLNGSAGAWSGTMKNIIIRGNTASAASTANVALLALGGKTAFKNIQVIDNTAINVKDGVSGSPQSAVYFKRKESPATNQPGHR